MKKTFYILTAFLILSFYNGIAQNTQKNTEATNSNDQNTEIKRKCGTMEHMEELKANDPSFAIDLQQLEEYTQNWIKNNPNYEPKAVITIPVVVHIVYNTAAQNLSDARVNEQIAALNRDYKGLNTHSMGAFSTTLKANTELQFCLASKDNNGAATTGIERRSTTTTGFAMTNNPIKHYSTGGLDQWNPQKYMNIWVGNLTGGLCGYAQFPTASLNNTFGVVIHYQYFGVTGASYPYNQGGTTTHEIGHCFNLYHVWGDDGGACNGTDNCTDTPNQAGENYTCPGTGATVTDGCTAASPGVMYMNFMDYSDDACYANFTPNQKSRIQALFAASGSNYLAQLGTSAASNCSGVGITEVDLLNEIQVFPNPANDILNIDLTSFNKEVKISIYNSIGSLVKSIDSKTQSNLVEIDLSSFTSGVYYVNILSDKGNVTKRVSVIK